MTPTSSVMRLVVIALTACSAARPPASTPSAPAPAGLAVLPSPKEVHMREGVFVVTAQTPIQLVGTSEASAMSLLEVELKAGAGAATGSIVLEQIARWPGTDRGPEGYTLDVTREGVRAQATGPAGLFYAAQTLLQLVVRAPAATTIPAVHIVDWPDIEDRMVLYDFRFDNFNLDYTKRWIHELSRMKVNQLMIFLSGDYRYEKYPFIAPPEKLTREKLRELKRYAVAHHVQLVPQVESLGHAEGVLAHEEFRDIRLGEQNTYAYSPCTSRTYDVLGDFYRELSDEFDQTDLFHVGGDEVWGFDQDKRCAVTTKDDHRQSQLYAEHMQKLSAQLRSMNRRMAVWSDMILKHRDAAEGLSRDTVIFDWDYSEDYKRFDNFPSLKVFKDLGFRNIYATAAVLGFNDMYPLLPVAFQNIRGFTQAALREDIRSVCVTMWEMQPGNNAENYLYGLAWSGHIMWSSQATNLAEFNRRFASVWFGIRDDAAAAHVDRMFWFPWRVSGDSELTEKDSSGFWQIEHRTAELLYMKFEGFAAFHKADDLRRLPGEADQLLDRLDAAAAAIRWLDDRNSLNQQTLQSMQMSNAFYRFLAHKVRALATLSTSYRDAYAAGDRARTDNALAVALGSLDSLSARFSELRDHMRIAVAERNRSPDELGTIDESAQSLAAFAATLTKARTAIAQGQPLPPPQQLGLEPKP